MRSRTLAIIILSTAISISRSTAQTAQPFDSDTPAPPSWKQTSQPDPSTPIALTIPLNPSSSDAMENQLLAVSDPTSPTWRSFVSASAARDLVAASDTTVSTVFAWLESADINGTVDCDTVVAQTTVASAEQLLNCTYSMWEDDSGKKVLRTDTYCVPDDLRDAVRYVSPGTHFPVTLTAQSSAQPAQGLLQAAGSPYQPQHVSSTTQGGFYPSNSSYAPSNASYTQSQTKKFMPRSSRRTFRTRDAFPTIGNNSRLVKACLGGNNSTISANSTNNLNATNSTNGTDTSNIRVVPECWRAAYGIDMSPIQNPNASLAILDPDGGMFSDDDLQIFLQKYASRAAATRATFTNIPCKDWDDSNTYFSNETNVDTQTSLGLISAAIGSVSPGTVMFYQADLSNAYGDIGGESPEQMATGEDIFITFLKQLVTNETVPSVVSLSAGANEGFVPQPYAHRVCSLIGAAGARGVTFVTSTGDTGPLSNVVGNHNNPIDAQFPASCPWVLAVGATANPFNESAATATTATLRPGSPMGFSSGGGFSNIYTRPAYQKDVVGRYIDQSVPESMKSLPGFNATGRGYPDVAALGAQTISVMDGQDQPGGGTSVSTPAWAAVIALLNAVEESKGRPCIGFANPWLYWLASRNQGLRDIVLGDGTDYIDYEAINDQIPDSGLIPPFPPRGYDATPGWDATTGLGVPIWADLMASL